jgi:glycosyltransferase involved in cell wall biosynthesis
LVSTSLKKKILVISSTFPRWENDHEPPFVYELSRQFTKKYDVHVLAPHAAGSLNHETLGDLSVHRFRYAPERLEKLAYNGGISTNLKMYPLRYLLVLPFLLAELFSAIRILRKENIDLIHAHWIIPQGLIAIIAATLAKNRPAVLITAHGADVYTRKGSLISSIKRFILNHCNHLTVVSQGMAASVHQLNANCDIDIIPMGTDLTDTFVPDNSKRTNSQLVFVGRLVEKKGVRYLIDGFKKLLSRYPQLTLVIIGHGPEKESLQEYARALGILDKVKFTGGLPQAELPVYLQQSSIAIFPFIQADDGDQEGFGLVLVEAMGCGCTTIATCLPAVQDIISNRTTGILIEEKNSDEVCSAVSELLDDPVLRNELSVNGRNHVKDNFDWPVIANSYLKLLNTMLEAERV